LVSPPARSSPSPTARRPPARRPSSLSDGCALNAVHHSFAGRPCARSTSSTQTVGFSTSQVGEESVHHFHPTSPSAPAACSAICTISFALTQAAIGGSILTLASEKQCDHPARDPPPRTDTDRHSVHKPKGPEGDTEKHDDRTFSTFTVWSMWLEWWFVWLA